MIVIKKLTSLFLLFTSIALFLLTFRGSPGNPSPDQVEYSQSASGQPFETSQERSRWAMILSMYNDKVFHIDNYASMGTPDIGFINGHYYSFFPPTASILALPLFIIGSYFGVSQLATFSITSIFTLFTMLLIFRFSRKLDLHWSVALFTALAYGFATNAWGYSVTLYAHPISAFFILLGLYATVFAKNWKGALLFWICYSMGVFLDFPNLFIFFPLAVVWAFRFFSYSEDQEKRSVRLRWQYFFTPFLFVALMLGYAYYNYTQFGHPAILSNTIPRVKDLHEIELSTPEAGREAVGALHTRNMLEGFTSFIVSQDRGLLFYTPIAFLAIFGLGVLKRKDKEVEVLLFTIPATCLVLYTMFGDPYGGWAFGSRYLLAVMPELMILAGLGLARAAKNIWIKILFSATFVYSSAVSLLAPLTTNVIPPYVEARYLNLRSDYRINWEMLQEDRLSSFFYNHVLQQSIPGVYYYLCIAVVVAVMGLTLIWVPKEKYDPSK